MYNFYTSPNCGLVQTQSNVSKDNFKRKTMNENEALDSTIVIDEINLKKERIKEIDDSIKENLEKIELAEALDRLKQNFVWCNYIWYYFTHFFITIFKFYISSTFYDIKKERQKCRSYYKRYSI